MEITSCVGKKKNENHEGQSLHASKTTEGHCVGGLNWSTGRSGRLGFDRDVYRLGERASSNRFADNSSVGKGGRVPFALVPW